MTCTLGRISRNTVYLTACFVHCFDTGSINHICLEHRRRVYKSCLQVYAASMAVPQKFQSTLPLRCSSNIALRIADHFCSALRLERGSPAHDLETSSITCMAQFPVFRYKQQ